MEKLIVFNFGLSDDMEILVINDGKVIQYIEDRRKPFKHYLDLLADRREDSYCYLPRDAYVKSVTGKSCFDILMNAGFRIA